MPSKTKRVLIVDNDEQESRVLASMLERAGYHSTTTWSGLEALELLEAREFDIALVSSYLPDLYVGDFFKRFNCLPVQPCAIVMQEGQACADTLVQVKSVIGEENHSGK
jgi:CheY-like chemotaxis protein